MLRRPRSYADVLHADVAGPRCCTKRTRSLGVELEDTFNLQMTMHPSLTRDTAGNFTDKSMELRAKRTDTHSERYRNRQGLICIQFAKAREAKLRKNMQRTTRRRGGRGYCERAVVC